MKQYAVKSIFGPTLQGEGDRSGIATMFLRFAGCNLQCVDADQWKHLAEPRPLKGNEVDVGFFCDTDFMGGERLTAAQIVERLVAGWGNRPTEERRVVVTGGEPLLQLSTELVWELQQEEFFVAVETNGTVSEKECRALDTVNWVSCSPKLGTERKVVLRYADEIRVVVKRGQEPHDFGITERSDLVYDCLAKFVSPAWEIGGPGGYTPQLPNQANMAWAVQWCLDNPDWRLSLQQHKLWGVP